MLESQIPEKKEQIIQSLQKKRPKSIIVISEVKRPEKVCSYATLAATRPAQNLERL